MTRFVLSFTVLLALLFTVEITVPVQRHFVAPWTQAVASLSAAGMQAFDPAVVARGRVIASQRSGFAVSIEAGCNGIEALIVLVAAILAFPAPVLHKLAGIAAGAILVQGLNILRVVSLFYLGQWNQAVFEWAHLYLWQALIMLDVLVVWLVWIRLLPREPAPRAA